MFLLVSFIPRKQTDETHPGFDDVFTNKIICRSILFFSYKGGKLYLEALLSWFEELWSRRPVAASAGGDGTKPPKGKKKGCTSEGSGL